ncbi:MAG: hypothetical protein ACUVWX_15035 [Kiritimatiellia bacterium]
MNLPQLKNWSQRQQVLAVLLIAGAVIIALWFFVMTPLNRERRRLEREIAEMRSQLARKNYLLGEEVLQAKKMEALREAALLQNEWRDTIDRVALPVTLEEQDEGGVERIDYKMAWLEACYRLTRKARDLNVALPPDVVGISPEVTTAEDPYKLMLQLRAAEKLLDAAMDLKINAIKSIKPLAPIPHTHGSAQEVYLEEYPIQISFYGTLENMYKFLSAICQPGQVFAVRRMKIDAASASKPKLLAVTAEVTAFIFLKTPEKMSIPLPQRDQRVGPKGS